MPLIHGKSKKAFDENVKTEMDAHPGPEHRAQNLAIAYAVKRKAKKMAHGGMIHEEEMADDMEHDHEIPEEDMISKIMKEHYSEGGMVANGGEDELDHMADGQPNEFDELAKDDHLEFSYTGANSGDELGNEELEHDDKDIIAKVMRSLAKKDRLPNPR